jgi:hypothetical protein
LAFFLEIAERTFHLRKFGTPKSRRKPGQKEIFYGRDNPLVVRGYDSRDLFWEDMLLRIDEVKRQIAADLKKED